MSATTQPWCDSHESHRVHTETTRLLRCTGCGWTWPWSETGDRLPPHRVTARHCSDCGNPAVYTDALTSANTMTRAWLHEGTGHVFCAVTITPAPGSVPVTFAPPAYIIDREDETS